MPNINKTPSHEANLRKFGHDLSKVRKFSSSVGQLLPVYYDLSLPGDKYRLNTEMFTQVTDMVSPAMMHVEQHLDWFFVPLKQIFDFSEDNLYGIRDWNTSLLDGVYRTNNTLRSVVPMFDVSYIQSAMQKFYDGTYSDINSLNGSTDTIYGKDEYNMPCVFNFERIAELLGYSYGMFLGAPNSNVTNQIYINPTLLCAYQKIWFDCYRLTDFNNNEPKFYNLDKWYSTGVIDGTTLSNITNLFKLRYRPFERDFFYNSTPAPLIDFGSDGMQGGFSVYNNSLALINNWLTQNTNRNVDGTSSNSVTNLSVSSINSTPGLQTNTAALRGMFAAEKLMEITRRAAKRYDSQTLAHFGFKVSNDYSDHVIRVGNEKSIINVNQVVASTAGSPGSTSNVVYQGQKGGYGAAYSGAGKKITFTAPCHGVLMGVFSAMPKVDYPASGLDRINSYVTRYDYYQPELDRLGMQPLFEYQAKFTANSPSNNSTVKGWQYRYQELKQKYNDICGAFLTKPYDTWTISRRHYTGMFAWYSFSVADRYCHPYYLDSVLLLHQQYDGDESLSMANCFGRDPLLHWFKFNVYKSSVMTTYSLPNL